jgi:hypothetical protein
MVLPSEDGKPGAFLFRACLRYPPTDFRRQRRRAPEPDPAGAQADMRNPARLYYTIWKYRHQDGSLF